MHVAYKKETPVGVVYFFQECEGLRNIADNAHTPHRALFLSAFFVG